MKRSLVLLLAIAGAEIIAAASSARGHTPKRNGALHVTKVRGLPRRRRQFCTIESSNINMIKPGMQVVYREAPGDNGVLDTDIVLSSGHGVSASGHVVLNLATAKGAVTLSGEVGRFKRFQADAVVSVDSARIWHWDSTYRFDDD